MSASLKDSWAAAPDAALSLTSILSSRLSGPLVQLIDALASLGRQLSTEELIGTLQDAPLTLTDVQPFIRFNDDSYGRQMIYECDQFEVRCLSWRRGQFSLAHDHGHCRCCVRVMHGTLTISELECSPEDSASVVRQTTPVVGGLVATPPYSVHQAGNAQHQDLVTLHVYSPRLQIA